MAKEIIVMTFGTFDFFHQGHQYFLKKAKKYGTKLITVVARDKNVELQKGYKPEHDEIKRKNTIKESRLVDEVILGNTKDKFKVIREKTPNIIVLGYDQKAPIYEIQKEFPEIKIKRVDSHFPEKFSSSIIRKNHK
jgi:cytidyltransferase-like protein